ncbi:MAG: phytoene desaturase [Chitinophagales bacterium]|nr:phytoene desaturase [Chitinophagales bacterium]MCB9021355.1 phytoene desaturase [Chitinophagales bacterium]MCB9031690.1 phytoene desaturase [Chitinophagales bacterium]HPE97852.1 phytoene desaturase family protein [Chitinophagales bacterium]HPR28558.1 phytoene desaturase family protein [Chitinophagales bacterium]
MKKHVVVIGAGFSGLSAACELASNGFQVTVLEKNSSAGGRAAVFHDQGYTFDMGPSWYWMPDVFDWFFERYGSSVAEQYDLQRLDPGYRVFFGKDDIRDIPASLDDLYALFEAEEPGSARHLKKFLDDAAYKYKVGMQDLVFKPCHSVMEFADKRLLSSLFRMQLFTSLEREVRSKFKSEKLRRLLEFPVYFLGALPSNTPALYSILNYADLVLGTWYPMGGMGKIVEGMQRVAENMGVQFRFNSPATGFDLGDDRVKAVLTADGPVVCDGVIASADYQFVEQQLLPADKRNYSAAYWNKKVMAPSCLIYYLGVDGTIDGLKHHNLFFDESFDDFAEAIYTNPKWPENPLFYTCIPTKTDASVAPDGKENLFILIPVAPGLEDTDEIRSRYFEKAMDKLEKHTGQQIRHRVEVQHSFAYRDFVDRYHSFRGNAYGLANTLMQTAVFKPKMRNKHLNNLLYAGQLTVPGPGVPPSLVSGNVAAGEMQKMLFAEQKIEQIAV